MTWLRNRLALGISTTLTVLAAVVSCDREPQAPPATRPASAPAATTQKTAPAKHSRTFLDVVQANRPDFPTTEPLVIPGFLDEASRVVVRDPLFIDSRQDLWVTRDDAPPITETLQSAGDEQVHVVPDRVVFVHWTYGEKSSMPTLVVAVDSRYELVSAGSRVELQQDQYDWTRAFSWSDRIVVPTRTGACVLDLHGRSPSLALPGGFTTPPQVLIENDGLLCWAPWDNNQPGSKGAARYRDGKWTILDSSNGWPGRILHLCPLREGSVLQISRQEDGRVKLSLDVSQSLSAKSVDITQVEPLVEKLSDPDPKIRQKAFTDLGQFGPGAFSILEKLRDAQPVGAQNRIDDLLEAKITPKVGTIAIEPGPVTTAQRLRDGGVVLYFEDGVVLPHDEDAEEEELLAPAWISLRPAFSPQVLSPFLVAELAPGKQTITAFFDEWIVSDPVNGPRRFMGNHFRKMLKKDERTRFTEFVGVDRRARWIYRNPEDKSYLVVDPTLPDPSPRLPVWEYPVHDGKAGWTRDDWPAVQRGGTWVLSESDWRPLDEKTEQFLTELPEIAPATAPTMQPTTGPTSRPILVEPDGTRFYDGKRSLVLLDSSGAESVWPLPGSAVGDWDYIRLFRAGDNRLFLFNQPGRVLRIAQTGNPQEPFKLEAAFTSRIPTTDTPRRIWQDPSGRIIIAQDEELTILFPSGRIPPKIAEKMSGGGEDDE